MAQRRAERAGGVLLCGAILVGVAVGVALGQASIGFLVGLALGLLALLAVWLAGRR